jgi:hypothetical protein
VSTLSTAPITAATHAIARLTAAIAVALVLTAATVAAVARATAPPVGALPPGPKSTIVTQPGQLVAVALPSRGGGRSWRIARAFDDAVVRQVSEANVGSNVVVVFKSVGEGQATLAFALTRGETAKALEARTFSVRVK